MAAGDTLQIGRYTVKNRLFLGTGKYPTLEIMRDALAASDCHVVTVAVRRVVDEEKAGNKAKIVDYINLDKYLLLPNTAGCYTAQDAVRMARLAREMTDISWVKLEVLADPQTLLPDPLGTLEACTELVKDDFDVLCYTSDDPVMAQKIEQAGAAAVMPAGSPIGSGQGILNHTNMRIILERVKAPVIIDAGVGTASDVTLAMELGAEGVLLNTGVACAKDPVKMAAAMKHALAAGWLAAQAGRIPKKLYATASSPLDGLIAPAHRPHVPDAGVPGE